MSNVPDAILPELYRLYTKPYQIYEVYLESPYITPSHRFVAYKKDIVFGGNTYTALAIKRGTIKSEEGTIINEVEIGLANADLEFKNQVASGSFNKKRVVAKIVFDGFLTNAANYILLLDGDLDEPKGDEEWVTMTVTPFPMFEREYPNRVFQFGCNAVFGDADCTINRSLYQENKVVGAGSTAQIINITDDLHANNYWLPGHIEMTSGELDGIVRPIGVSIGTIITLRVPFESAPAEGDTFTVSKLCAKNPTTCATDFNNYEANYFGFPFVPKEPRI